MSKKFTKQNSQKYAVVHRPHDDPHYYDEGASAHLFVPIKNPNARVKVAKGFEEKEEEIPNLTTDDHFVPENEKGSGDASAYGIKYDDSKYDYMQHLKPIGQNPDSVFIPSKKTTERGGSRKKNIEDMFVEPEYKDVENKPTQRVFQGGVGKPEYLAHQQNVTDEISGFRPEMNPALREVLEALEDEAYVVNEDIVVEPKQKKKIEATKTKEVQEEVAGDDEDDIFAELLAGGEVEGDDDFEDQFDEWDGAELEDYEDEHYMKEMEQFDNVENLEDLQDIDYQADVRRFQREKKNDWDSADESDNEFLDDNSDIGNMSGLNNEEEEEENDALGDLPAFKSKPVKGSKKRRSRQKKGAMSDISGFSMSSSAIARTETMTVLDDQYDSIINGYDNYEENQAEDEENTYQPFDMSKERSDFESLVDDFLDNYELESGGRKLVKKNQEVQKYKDAADAVSKGKLSQRRNRERESKEVKNVTNSLSSLRF
ncbi:similar to Saccharomyces cerevisiae YKL143W LTV1 Component of the GSE complex, which is required for proper sorting of amino acid permease Gap1p [Maudiozyma barnettii]|uniref:Similar to Saccharomyces cerevisiae YKL143W LTV1 Component of the GSE complex, which is required for proper sorting of amino acid permease Gap1p n=1 Tax=Maudiozyma barnettii TaxID=61262 RepID=A0A8H2ZFX5_9SACH|nr:Ltv1p [Kazachstania barnettii]CAB4252820.1 similar to Saccharomyces cerevisiae YKL143W LTV1 Component of the GSE complex, which is required for proper sorting of amino acid permease Gap1p [Kazachstania barnettii]CAD1780610.1 similar to Saccharomyces cerevisiae YKL143W LTV1 Component of the GSE complex, which is required for proper sorting of amino acid permease Gap1p [Kazachstania barnettii]